MTRRRGAQCTEAERRRSSHGLWICVAGLSLSLSMAPVEDTRRRRATLHSSDSTLHTTRAPRLNALFRHRHLPVYSNLLPRRPRTALGLVLPPLVPLLPASAASPLAAVSHMGIHKGHCLCGRVQLEIDDSVLPLFSLYCHCKDCTRWQGGAVVTETLFPLSGTGPGALSPVKIVAGSELLRTYSHKGQVQRQWCEACGSHLLGVSPHTGVVAVYPGTFRGSQLAYTPTMVISSTRTGHCGQRQSAVLADLSSSRVCTLCGSTSTTRVACWLSLIACTSGRTSRRNSEGRDRSAQPRSPQRTMRALQARRCRDIARRDAPSHACDVMPCAVSGRK